MLAIGLLCNGASCFGLEWEAKERSVSVARDQATVTGSFSFKNTGARPVTILATNPDCDCVSAFARETVIAPGKIGFIDYRFLAKGQEGILTRRILVKTDEPKESAITLVLRLELPMTVAVEPRELIWRLKGETAEKSVLINAVRQVDGVEVEKIDDGGGEFDYVVKKTEQGKINIFFRPKRTDRIGQTTFRIVVSVEGEAWVFAVLAIVR